MSELTHYVQEKCAGCGKFKIIGVEPVKDGFIGRGWEAQFAFLWDTEKRLCPACKPQPQPRPLSFRYFQPFAEPVKPGIYVNIASMVA